MDHKKNAPDAVKTARARETTRLDPEGAEDERSGLHETRPDAPSSRSTSSATDRQALLPRIGRFTILSCLGEGAMGIVYAAYDDQLDRKVAVKMLRDQSLTRDSMARERMLREAQVMARVSHPNIVTVHEVGTHDDEIWIAMEFIRGVTLTEWLAAAPRPWREIVDVFLQAGRGLAAAHAAGIVHRDFKPANTLVSGDGVVKVLDFGLARSVRAHTMEQLKALDLDPEAELDLLLTHPGTVVGTPAYMSPEQHLGNQATRRSDQFGFN